MVHFPLSPPSGRQHPISAAGVAEAVLVDVGGGVRQFSMGGRRVLAGYAESEMTPRAHGTILVPWPNRVEGGRYRHAGVEHQLDISEPALGNAIHGLARWARWSAIDESAESVELAYDLPPSPGYPFALQLAVRWTVSAAGLRAEHRAGNVGDTSAPFGLGVHPYLDLGGAALSDAWLQVPAERYLALNDRLVPTGAVSVEHSPLDLRGGIKVGDLELNMAFTGLNRGSDGLARVLVRTPGGADAAVWMDESFGYLQIFGCPGFSGSGDALAVEPMTCAPDAFNSGDGLIVLEPGERWEGSWGVSPA